MLEEKIILVNELDEDVGTEEKIEVHRRGLLHRAFSLFIYDEITNCMLIQRRAVNKYHSGGLWTNACCSHPRKGETVIEAVQRRTKEELGIIISKQDIEKNKIIEIGKFKYYKNFGDLAEHEIDHVFIWKTNKNTVAVTPCKDEIYEVKWIQLNDLNKMLKADPKSFTAWFPEAYQIFNNYMLDCLLTKEIN